jgi:hypothetical protein
MTKKEWQEHWKEQGPHDTKTCSLCAERKKTKRANTRRKERESIFESVGLRKGKDSMGKTIWE